MSSPSHASEALLIAAVWLEACSAGDANPNLGSLECPTPDEQRVHATVLTASGDHRTYTGQFCVSVEYCEHTFSGCDPPNLDDQCMAVETSPQGEFVLPLAFWSPDPRDTIFTETFTLGDSQVVVSHPRAGQCQDVYVTFRPTI